MIPEELISKVKEENNIVDVISEYVKLRRVGSNYTGLCPFHTEKTPSFSVSEDKQIFKCFGCGEAGNVITFIMKYKNLSFPDAVKLLADRVNIEFYTSNNEYNEKVLNKKSKLYEINVEAARYFFTNLFKNKTAQYYFLKRDINVKTIKKFGLGYAKDSWNNLIEYMTSKGYSKLDLLEAGLIVKGRNGSFYDRFRNRVIFPVFNYRGNVIGFGGRVLDDSKPKYLNSPETEIFKKGTNLYGINYAIKNLKEDYIIIVEGYMDCISLNQRGITNVVASLGTALTVNQAKLLKRYVNNIIISYDADSAGQTATLRGLDILKEQGFAVKVLMIPKGKDPDEFVKINGKASFLQLVDKSLPLVDYKLKKAKEDLDLNNETMLIQYGNKAANILAKLEDIERNIYVKKVSEDIGIPEQVIYDNINKKLHKNFKNEENIKIEANQIKNLYLEPAYIKAERTLLKIMINNNIYADYVQNNLREEDFIEEVHKKMFNMILEKKSKEENDVINAIEVCCQDEKSSEEIVKIQDLNVSINNENYIFIINDCISEIKKVKLEKLKKELIKKIKNLECQGLIEESIQLAKELVEIQKKISSMELVEGGK